MVRAALIGLDGADPTWFLPALELGLMPNLHKHFANHIFPCQSTIPSVSAVAWPAITTGAGPGRLGILDFFCHDVRRYKWQVRPATSLDISLPFIWEQATAQDKSSLIINLPLTYPACPVKGAIISGFPSRINAQSVYPTDLLNRLHNYQIDISKPPLNTKQDLENYCRQLGELEKNHAKLASQLLREANYDLFMINLTLPDRLGHVAAPQLSDLAHGNVTQAVKLALSNLDDAFAMIYGSLGSETDILMVSDHGMGMMANQLFCPDRWLVKEGYMELAGLGRSWNPKAWLAALGITRSGWKRFWGRGDDERKQDKMGTAYHALPAVWEHTRAFSMPLYGNYFGIYLNRKKLMQQGVVEDGRMSGNLLDEISLKLGELVLEQTKPVKQIWRREELWSGIFLPLLPDLIVELCDGWGYDGARGSGDLVKTNLDRRVGDHRQVGIFSYEGPSFITAPVGLQPQLTDIAPTLLYLLGLPFALLDGKLLTEIISPPLLEKYPPKIKEIELRNNLGDNNPTDVKGIEDQLRGMGYLS